MEGTRPAVFLDRDGTINEQMGYVNHLSRFILLPGVGRAIQRLNKAGLPVVVISNQSGVARGYFPEKLITQVHHKMETLLARDGARLDGIYYCPHHPRAEDPRYRRECDCRKPGAGLLHQAAADLHLDFKRSFMVGDRTSDLKAARQVGAKAILVLTGYGRGELEYVLPDKLVKPDWIAEDLNQAVTIILGELRIG
jgi:D-glycero-D-manno-heptose 1,7-bisphosphate phosphatase